MAQACSECQTANADGAMFCRACGAPMQALVADLPEGDAVDAPHCDDCGHRNPSGARFCERCGYELAPWVPEWAEDDAVTPAPAAQPAAAPQPSPPPLPAAWSHAAAPGEDTFDPLSAPTLVMSHTAPAPLPAIETFSNALPRRRPLRWVAAGLGLLAATALLAWLGRPGTPEPSPSPTPVALPAPAAASAGVVSAVPASVPASVPALATPASAPIPASVMSVDEASAPAAAPARSTVPATASEPRKRLPEPVPRKRAQEAPVARVEPAPAAPPASVAAPATAPPARERAKTVTEACAGSNLLLRGFCEQRECRKAELVADPTCVRLKDAEQKRLFQQ
jgi:ribosomal protein L40E